jgi:hypothetical protein
MAPASNKTGDFNGFVRRDDRLSLILILEKAPRVKIDRHDLPTKRKTYRSTELYYGAKKEVSILRKDIAKVV